MIKTVKSDKSDKKKFTLVIYSNKGRVIYRDDAVYATNRRIVEQTANRLVRTITGAAQFAIYGDVINY